MPQAPYRRVDVIVNPASGRDEPVLNVLDGVFRTHQVDWTVSVTHNYGDAADQARQAIEDGFDPIRTLGITAVLAPGRNGSPISPSTTHTASRIASSWCPT